MCVIPLKFCIVLFHARQILMPQPILIAPRGPHRFIPSGEGASPSPFGPLNARGCVHEPPCGGPPWPPLLPGPRKQKISGRVSVCHTFFSEISRPCAPYVRLHLRVFFDFDYFDYGFSPKMVITTALPDFEFFCFEDLPDMLERCRRAQIKHKDLNLNLETSPA